MRGLDEGWVDADRNYSLTCEVAVSHELRYKVNITWLINDVLQTTDVSVSGGTQGYNVTGTLIHQFGREPLNQKASCRISESGNSDNVFAETDYKTVDIYCEYIYLLIGPFPSPPSYNPHPPWPPIHMHGYYSYHLPEVRGHIYSHFH